jgi:hypothetical protein
VKQVEGTILKGDAKDITRECIDRHEANAVGTEKCAERVCCSTAILHVAMALGQFNVILNTKDRSLVGPV